GLLPGLAVLGILAGMAIAGHLAGWRVSNVPQLWNGAVRSEETGDNREDADKKESAPAHGLRFPSQEALEKSGIKTATVSQRPLSQFVVANGTIDYSRDRLAHRATRAPGHVWKVYKRVGEPVRKGDVLGLIDAGEVGRAKAEYLSAVRSLEL